MITIDDSQIKDYQNDLMTFKRRAFPFATKATINGAAFMARGFAQENIRNSMITRNRFTVASIRVEQSKTLNISRQAAIVGSTADYMEDQEFGATKVKKGKQGINLPTSYSAGQSVNSQPRTRLPRRPNAMQNIQLSKRRKKGANRKQRNLIAVKQAAQSGSKFVFLDLGNKKGVFKVMGGKRKPYLRMVSDLSETSVRVPKNPWLGPAVTLTQQHIPELYRDALRFQLKKHGLFRNR